MANRLENVKGYDDVLKRVENFFYSEGGRSLFGTNWDWLKLREDAEKLGFYLTSGCTKWVLIDEDLDFVIKFRTDISDGLDYCDLEARHYAIAVKDFDDVADKLAWTKKIGRVCGIPIYIQEKVDCDEDKVSSSLYDMYYKDWLDEYEYEDSEEKRDEYYEDYGWNIKDANWDETSDLFWSAYGNISDLNDWVDQLSIGDLHTGNMGFRGDKIVLTDYSGYGMEWLLSEEGFARYKSF